MSIKTDQRAKRILQVLLRTATLLSMNWLPSLALLRPACAATSRGLNCAHGAPHPRRRQIGRSTQYEPFRFDSSYQEREGRFAEEKRHIGLVAAELIREHDTVGFTAGTTTTQVARCIRHRSGIRVITNAVNIGMELNTQAGLT